MRKSIMRLMVFILAILMIMSNMLSVFAENYIDSRALCTHEVLFDNDFEDSGVEFRVAGQAKTEFYDKAHGMSMKIALKNGAASTTFYEEFKEPVIEGLLYVGYDQLKTAKGGRTYDILYDRPAGQVKWLEGMYISGMHWNGNYLSYASELDVLSTYTTNPHLGAPPAEEWTHIDYWYDMDNRMVYAYMDGEEYFVTPITDKLQQITAVGYIGNPNGLDTDVYFDNYKVIHFKNGFDESVVSGAEYIPGYVKSGLHAELKTGILGHNFFTKEIKFNVELNNELDTAQTAEVGVNVINDNGNCVYTKTDTIELKSNSVESLPYGFTAEDYGYYDVFVDIIPQYGEAYTIDVRNRLSCIKKAEKPNPLMGMNDHLRNQELGLKEVDGKMELFKNTGMGLFREGLVQHFTRLPSGEYKRDEIQTYWESVAKEHGITHVVLLDGEASNRLPKADDPASSAEFEKYVYSIVKEMEGRSNYFEVGNEVNYVSGFNSNELVQTNYIHALKIAYNAAKRANPNCEVMALALCEYALDYVEAFLAAGGGEYMDGISIHPYMLTQTPEDGGMYEKLQVLKDLMEKYGCGDKKIYVTEIGWTNAEGYTTDERKTAYQLRTQILIGHEVDMMLWYCAQYHDMAELQRERNFGFIYGDFYDYDKVSYGAHPSLFTMSHWNSLMLDSKFEKRIDGGSDDIRLYKYKLADGRDVIAAYTTDEEQNKSIGLDLGTSSVELRDMYGNPQTIYAKDGVISVSLGFEPVYIIGQFLKEEVTKSKIELPASIVNMINGEDTVVEIKTEKDDGLSVEVGVPDGFEITENNGFSNGEAKVLFKSSSERVDRGKVRIDIKENDRLLFTHKCSIQYSDPISYTYKISPYNNQKVWIEADFTNHRITPVRLELELDTPDGLSKKKYVIERIDPMGTRRLRINVPVQYMNQNKIKFSGTVYSGNGTMMDTQPFEAQVTSGFVHYTNKKPVIDGVISKDEWIKDLGMIFDARNNPLNMIIKDKSDLYGKGYLMCDDDYLYFAAELEDDVLGDFYPPSKMYDGDSVQIAFAQEATYGKARTELTIGLSEGESHIVRYSFMGSDKTAADMNVFKDTEVVVRRDENEKKTYYEVKLPWSECFDTKFDPKARGTMAFSVCLNDNDGLGVNNAASGRGYYEYIGGIGSSKDSGKFIALPILKQIKK
ncbi:MAG: hypothetical protein J6D26_00110 [Clostridia bacterium]|nr:hypothetical protein [Clostridia bacterium]